MTDTIGVIIVSYHTRGLLRDCLHSLHNCRLPVQIVVVDNASPDDSAAMVRAEFPAVDLLALDENLGFAGGNNCGLARLGYPVAAPTAALRPTTAPPPEYVLLLNPDTIVQPDAIETLVAFLDAHPRVGLVAPRLHNADGSMQASAFRFPTLSMSLLDVFPPGEVLPGRLYGSWWHGRYAQEQQPDTHALPFPIEHPLGACMLTRYAVVEHVGGLDSAYFMYSEEIDWCWRIRRAGWAIWQEPRAHVTHLGGGATSQFRWRMLVELHRSRVRFFRTHYHPAFLVAHRLITRAGMLRAMLNTWWNYRRGRLTRDELRTRLLAYGLICRL